MSTERLLFVSMMLFFVGGVIGLASGYCAMKGIRFPALLNPIVFFLIQLGFLSMGVLGAFMFATLVFTKAKP